jgi:sulfate adenylyltransferase subunit 2
MTAPSNPLTGTTAEELRALADPITLLRWTVDTFGDDFVVASNMQDGVLVHLAKQVQERPKVLFLDTGYHFPETIGMRDAVEAIYEVELLNVTPEQSVGQQDALLGKDLFASDPVLQPAQGGAAARDAQGLPGLGHGHPPGGVADARERAVHLLRRGFQPAQGESDRRLVRRGHAAVHRGERDPGESADRRRVPVDRLPALHQQARPRFRSSKRPLGRFDQDRMRTPRLMTISENPPATSTEFSTLDALESEAIHIFREVAGEFERPVILFSGGKDSTVLLHLAVKAFWPAPLPFALLHVDTGHNLPEVLAFRDEVVERYNLRLHVASVEDYLADGRLEERADGIRNPLQTVPLLDAITENKFDAVFGGGRRDEERARAKERIFSLRNAFGQWDPKRQRPELWNLYNGRHAPGEHVRVFPISNFTELDIWRYIAREDIKLASIYYAHQREVFDRDGMLMTSGVWGGPREGELARTMSVRYRTVGDGSTTGAIESTASNNEEIMAEVAASRLTERGATRGDDRVSEAAMEDRKKEGYF